LFTLGMLIVKIGYQPFGKVHAESRSIESFRSYCRTCLLLDKIFWFYMYFSSIYNHLVIKHGRQRGMYIRRPYSVKIGERSPVALSIYDEADKAGRFLYSHGDVT
jgi:hypothetical protein